MLPLKRPLSRIFHSDPTCPHNPSNSGDAFFDLQAPALLGLFCGWGIFLNGMAGAFLHNSQSGCWMRKLFDLFGNLDAGCGSFSPLQFRSPKSWKKTYVKSRGNQMWRSKISLLINIKLNLNLFFMFRIRCHNLDSVFINKTIFL